MKYISHRGNLKKIIKKYENDPNYILEAILNGFDVEIDIWVIKSEIYLGHDFNQFKIDEKFLIDNKDKLWIHAKNDQALFFLSQNKIDLNFFWHEGDKFTVTSKGFIWTHCNVVKQYLSKNVFVNKKIILTLPEIIDNDFKYEINPNNYFGICSDLIDIYRKKLSNL